MLLNGSFCRLGLYLVIGFALVTFTVTTYARADVGWVMDVSGEWHLIEDGRDVGTIERGQAITSGSIVRPQTDRGRIVIHLHDDRVIVCDAANLGECSRPLVLPRKPSVVGQFFAAFRHLISVRSPVWDFAGSRLPRDRRGELMEAVVKFNDGKIDLSPAFEKMRPGLYPLRLVPVGGVNAKQKLAPIVFKWEPGGPSNLSVPGITAGLYRLLLLDETKDNEPSGLEVWLLVTGSKRFPQTSARFQKARVWTQRWREKAGRDAQHTFLRGYLDHLSQASN